MGCSCDFNGYAAIKETSTMVSIAMKRELGHADPASDEWQKMLVYVGPKKCLKIFLLSQISAECLTSGIFLVWWCPPPQKKGQPFFSPLCVVGGPLDSATF